MRLGDRYYVGTYSSPTVGAVEKDITLKRDMSFPSERNIHEMIFIYLIYCLNQSCIYGFVAGKRTLWYYRFMGHAHVNTACVHLNIDA